MKEEDGVDLDRKTFGCLAAIFTPSCLLEATTTNVYPPPDDLIHEKAWDGIVVLPTDVLLKSTSYEGALVARLWSLHSDWIFSWPEVNTAPFVDEVSLLLVGEEFDALVFNAVHGYYRQAIGCLRNALELMTTSAGLAVTNNAALFKKWQEDGQEISFGQGLCGL